MATTAGTLCGAAQLLKDHGARSIRAAVTHALVTDAGIAALRRSPIEEIIATDSVPRRDWQGYPATVLSVDELLGEAILRIHNNESVSSLFRV